jgi:hypothetical protein
MDERLLQGFREGQRRASGLFGATFLEKIRPTEYEFGDGARGGGDESKACHRILGQRPYVSQLHRAQLHRVQLRRTEFA